MEQRYIFGYMMKMTSNREAHEQAAWLWNMAAGMINAGEAVVLLMVVTRTTGIEDAGIVTISMAVANMLMTIGKFGMKNLQVTDIRRENSFSTYLVSRIITVISMLGLAGIYAWNGVVHRGYTKEKALILFLICAIYSVEALEDVFWGLYQQKGRLDIGAKMFCIRWIWILSVYIAGLIMFRNLFRATFLAWITGIILLGIWLKKTYPILGEHRSRVSIGEVIELFRRAVPLAVSAYLSFYIINAPKYAIDSILSDVEQACYGFVSMPIFVIGLVNNFIYQPVLVRMAAEWEERAYDSLKKRIIKQLIFLTGVTGICILSAAMVGIPVLSFLYNTDLSAYKKELLILLLGGGALAANGYLSIILTIMKQQKKMMAGYMIIAVLAISFSEWFVLNYAALGAAILYSLLAFLLFLIFGGMIIYYWNRRKMADTYHKIMNGAKS